MFTGLIEEIGKINGINRIGNSLKIRVECNKILDDIKIDDSVSINGACQTVIKVFSNGFEVQTIEETIRKTNLSKLKIGEEINLERAMKIGSRFGGHIVQGHIDCIGTIQNIQSETTGNNFSISFPDEFRKYLINTGSITINGVSLTTSKINIDNFVVSLIPHTIKSTIFKNLKIGSTVNLEFDVIGKYIENLLIYKKSENSKSDFWNQFIDQPEF